ncbi:nuclear transport factor 2 family protein [Nocardia sp. NPDC049149]|uniref:nuclear transport factor 2 family protein n=1 Tax=Nocardia sp. NPDC049149 TaxID=3364315 RepID=UPI0037180792
MTITPESILRTFFSLMSDSRWDELADLYDEDAVVHHPFADDESALLVGREQLRRHFASFRDMGLTLRVRDVIMRPMADPAWLTCQFVYHAQIPGADHFALPGIFVSRTNTATELIAESYDYLGPRQQR